MFEAIVGAATLDCNWDMDIVYGRVMKMFRSIHRVMKQAQMNNNYVGQLQERISKLGLEQPECSVESYRKNNIQGWAATYKFGDILTSKSFGLTQKEAKRNAAKGILDYLDEHQDELVPKKENFNIFEFINQMIQTKVISRPSYDYSAEYSSTSSIVGFGGTNISTVKIPKMGKTANKVKTKKVESKDNVAEADY